jgi:hypothetical protein
VHYRLVYKGARIGCYRRGRALRKPRCAAGYHHPRGHFSCERDRLVAAPVSAPVATPTPATPGAPPKPVSPTPKPVTPTPVPTPTTPTPAPPADPLAARNQQMLQQAVDWGIKVRAQGLIDGTSGQEDFFYYGVILPQECVVANAGVGRCTLYMWWEQHDYAGNFTYTTTREIHRTSIFAQDLGTAVGFQMSSEPQGILGYDFNRPWYMICSTWFAETSACPADRWTPLPAVPPH